MSSGRDTWLSPPRYVPPRGYRPLGARKPLEDSPADITGVVTNFARVAPASWIDHDDWFRREVEQGRLSAREGRLLEHDEVASRIDQR
jgi:hypothetical protein